MVTFDPYKLPPDIRNVLCEGDAWKHHLVKLSMKKAAEHRKLLAEAGIFLKTGYFTKEEDDIIKQNWEKLKVDLDYKEGDDARVYVGFGLKSGKGAVGREEFNRAMNIGFNRRLCEGLDDRLLHQVKFRFSALFDPKRIALEKGQTPLTTYVNPTGLYVKDEDYKTVRMTERELKLAWKTLKTCDGNVALAAKQLEDAYGPHLLHTTVKSKLKDMFYLKDEEVSDANLYKAVMRQTLTRENIGYIDFCLLLMDENYDWNEEIDWLTLMISLKRLRKRVKPKWHLLLDRLRKVLSKFKESERPFLIHKLHENLLDEDSFPKYMADKEEEWGEKQNEEELRPAFEDLIMYRNDRRVNNQRVINQKQSRYRFPNFPIIVKFTNGTLEETAHVNRRSRPNKKRVIVESDDEFMDESINWKVDRRKEEKDDEFVERDDSNTPSDRMRGESEEREENGERSDDYDEEFVERKESADDGREKEKKDEEEERGEGERNGEGEVSSRKKKKRKRKSAIEESNEGETVDSIPNEKKKMKREVEEEEEREEEDEKAEKKRKKKKKVKEEEQEVENVEEDPIPEKKEKKRKKKKKEEEERTEDNVDLETASSPHQLDKKKKKRKIVENGESGEMIETPKKKKKKRISEMEEVEQSQVVEKIENLVSESLPNGKGEKKKKKRKSNVQ